MTDHTTQAEDLLKAVAKEADDCHDSPTACCHVLLNTAAGLKFREVAIPALAVAIKAIEAHLERPESEHDGGCSAGVSKLPCKCSQKDRAEALAEWGRLFPKEEENV